jgi:hypothetical protein
MTDQQLTPEQFIGEAKTTMRLLSPTEAFRIFEHTSAWTTVYYGGEVPATTAIQLHELELECRQSLITRADG